MYRVFLDDTPTRPAFVFNEMEKTPEEGDIFKVDTNVYQIYDVHHHLENHVLYLDMHLRPYFGG